MRRPPSSPFLPYTTLFRSLGVQAVAGGAVGPEQVLARRDLVLVGHLRVGGLGGGDGCVRHPREKDRTSTRLNSSHVAVSYAVFCLNKKIIRSSRFITCTFC